MQSGGRSLTLAVAKILPPRLNLERGTWNTSRETGIPACECNEETPLREQPSAQEYGCFHGFRYSRLRSREASSFPTTSRFDWSHLTWLEVS